MEIHRSLLEVDLAGHESRPTVSLLADAGLLTSGDNLRLPNDERDPIVGFSVGVAVEIPLFNWGATDLRIQQKQIAAENLQLENEQLRRVVDAQARRLQSQLTNASRRLEATRRTISIAEDNFLLTKSKFASGATLSLEVLSAQQMLTEGKLTETQALADIQTAIARIEQLLAR
jgi:outer membrane protein TolC